MHIAQPSLSRLFFMGDEKSHFRTIWVSFPGAIPIRARAEGRERDSQFDEPLNQCSFAEKKKDKKNGIFLELFCCSLVYTFRKGGLNFKKYEYEIYCS